jgi:hypothetical protein
MNISRHLNNSTSPACFACGHPLTHQEAEENKRKEADYRRDVTQQVEKSFTARAAAENTQLRDQLTLLKKLLDDQKVKNEELERDRDTKIAEEVEVRYQGLLQLKNADQDKKDAAHRKQLADTEAKLNAALRTIAEQNSARKGRANENTAGQDLRNAFPGDKFRRTHTGGDMVQTVMNLGIEVGMILHEFKDASRWDPRYSGKARADQLAEEAVQAVIWVATMPPDCEDAITFREGVHICEHSVGVGLTRVLRDTMIQLSLEKGGRNRDDVESRIAALMMTGKGHKMLVTLIDNNTQEATFDDNEKKAHIAVWKKRQANRDARQSLLQELFAEINTIVGDQTE